MADEESGTSTESLSEAAKINENIKKILNETKLTIDEINEGLEKRAKLEEDIGDSLALQANLAEAKEKAESDLAAATKARLEIGKKIANIQEKIKKDEYGGLELTSELNRAKQELIDKDNEIVALETAINESAERTLALNEDISKQQKELIENQKKFTDEAKKAAEAQKDAFDVMSEYSKEIPIIGNALSKAFAIKANLKKFASFLGDIGQSLDSEMIAGFGETLATKLQTITTMSIMTTLAVVGLAAQLGRMALEVNNLSKQIGAATGFGDVFNHQIVRMAAAGHMAGIGFQEAANSIKAMAEGLSSFNPTAEKTNQYVGLTIARLEKLGVSSASSVKSIDHMQRSMGMSAEAAADMTAQIARMGKEVGITGTKMLEQFNSASGRLAIYGKNNVKVFKELAAQAKATGIEMGTLLSISEKFDKFDTAADSAAQLNAVLGTQLSTLEMMNATDSERVMMLKQQVQMSVGNFDSLDKYTKQYIAHAMGVKDVAEAQRLLNMSTAEYQKYQQGQKESADIQKEIADASAEIVPVMQQLKLAALQFFMAFSPLIGALASFLTITAPVIGFFAEWIRILAPFAATLLGVLFIVGKFAAGVAGLVSFLNPISATIIGVVGALTLLFDVLHLSGSPMLWEMPMYLAGAFGTMAQSLLSPISLVKGLASSFASLFESLHPKDTGMNFDVEALAKMDTSKVASGFKQIKSALMDLSTLKVDGFLAMKTDGTSSSFIMGSEGVIKSISEGKLTVDVKMPDMKMPDINVRVYIGDTELRDIIRSEIDGKVGKFT